MREQFQALRLLLTGVPAPRPAGGKNCDYSWPCGCTAVGNDLEASDIDYCRKHAAALGMAFSPT